MAAKNLESLRRKRAQAEKLATRWEENLIHSARKLKEYRRKEKLYTTLIEKVLEAEKAKQPKEPTRVVEI